MKFVRSISSCPVVHSIVGKRVIKYPQNVSLDISHNPNLISITTNGPLGKLHLELPTFIQLKQLEIPDNTTKQLIAMSILDTSDKKQSAMWGTANTLLQNMIQGVSEGYVVPIRLEGVGYRAALDTDNNTLVLRLGYSHPVIINIPDGISITIPAPQRILLRGIDKYSITQLAANIRKHRKPEPYNQKGIFVGDETIKKKEGKKR